MSNEQKNAVVVGGGLGGLETALYLRRRLGEEVSVTLVSERSTFVFKPYLTYVPFGLHPQDVRFDLAELAAAQGFRFRQGIAHEVDPARRMLRVSGQNLPYDALFLATGASACAEAVPGLHEHAFMLGREGDMVGLRHALDRLRSDGRGGARRRVVFLAPPGCGWTGALYELAFMLATWLGWKDARDGVELLLLTAERRSMEAFGPEVSATLEEELKARGIGARRWQRPRRVVGHPEVYAVGDASDYPVKQGFLALLQADAAAEDWAARVLGQRPAFAFEPEGAWLMEQLDQALVAQGELGENAHASAPPAHVERLPVGQLRRILVSEHLPRCQGSVNPLYSGLLWKGTETGLKMLRHLTRHEQP